MPTMKRLMKVVSALMIAIECWIAGLYTLTAIVGRRTTTVSGGIKADGPQAARRLPYQASRPGVLLSLSPSFSPWQACRLRAWPLQA